MKRLKYFMLLAAVIMLLLTACAPEEGGTQIPPDPEAAASEEEYVVLFFGDQTGKYLVKEHRKLSVPVNQTLEERIVEELVKGPASSVGGKLSLINPECRVTAVAVNDDVVTVTFDQHFLDWSFFGAKSRAQLERLKYLAVYSVVDTLVEATGYPKVQILIDKESSGVGSRLMCDQVGFMQESGKILGQLTWEGSVCLGPENTMSTFMDALKSGNYEEAYSIFAYSDSKLSDKPSSSYFSALLEGNFELESYEIQGISINYRNEYCCVIVDFSVRHGSTRRSFYSIPIRLVHENDIWKLEYSEFLDIFGEYIQD